VLVGQASGENVGKEKAMTNGARMNLMQQYPRTFTLGAHTMELLDDQSILLTNQGCEVVQLDALESYRLLQVLQAVFGERMGQEWKRDEGDNGRAGFVGD
jgi:hypothetical protein